MLLELLLLNAVLFLVLCVLPERRGERPEVGRRRAKALLRDTPTRHRSLAGATRDGARTVRDRFTDWSLPGFSAAGTRPALLGTGLLVVVAAGALVLSGDAAPDSEAATRLTPSEAACASTDTPPVESPEMKEISVRGVATEWTPSASSASVTIQIGL